MAAHRSGLAAALRRRAAVTAAMSALLFAAVYLLAVWTPVGQRFEDAVLNAAGSASGPAGMHATRILDAITTPTLVAATFAVLAIGLARHRWLLGVLGAGVVVGSVLTTEVVRRAVLRPVLLEHGYRREDQSFPSGHSAMAMSVVCALMLVVPYRLRGLVATLAALWAASVAVATVTASWHRPSDTLGSDLIVVGYTCLATAVLAHRGAVAEAAGDTAVVRLLRVLPRWVYVSAALLAFGGAAVAGGVAIDRLGGIGAEPAHAYALDVGRALALGGTVAATLAMLTLLRRVDLAPQRTTAPVRDAVYVKDLEL